MDRCLGCNEHRLPGIEFCCYGCYQVFYGINRRHSIYCESILAEKSKPICTFCNKNRVQTDDGFICNNIYCARRLVDFYKEHLRKKAALDIESFEYYIRTGSTRTKELIDRRNAIHNEVRGLYMDAIELLLSVSDELSREIDLAYYAIPFNNPEMYIAAKPANAIVSTTPGSTSLDLNDVTTCDAYVDSLLT